MLDFAPPMVDKIGTEFGLSAVPAIIKKPSRERGFFDAYFKKILNQRSDHQAHNGVRRFSKACQVAAN